MATDTTDTTGQDGRSPETVDRLLVGVCGAIWLVLLAMVVTAIVALVDLGRGHVVGGDGKQTPWLLYSVIVVSGLVILGAIPLLIRARRSALADPTASGESSKAPSKPRLPQGPSGKVRVFGATVDQYERYQPDFAQSSPSRRADALIPATALDRVWLRCTVSIAAAMGLAFVGVSLATYLLAGDKDTFAWVALGVSGLVTVLMPAIPVTYLRQLRGVLDEAPA